MEKRRPRKQDAEKTYTLEEYLKEFAPECKTTPGEEQNSVDEIGREIVNDALESMRKNLTGA